MKGQSMIRLPFLLLRYAEWKRAAVEEGAGGRLGATIP